MPDAGDITDAIATSAETGIKSAVIDGNSVTEMSIDERIKAAQHVAGTSAASTGKFGLRFTTLIPPACG